MISYAQIPLLQNINKKSLNKIKKYQSGTDKYWQINMFYITIDGYFPYLR